MSIQPTESQIKAGEKWLDDVHFYMSMETSDLKKFTSTFLRDDVIFHFTNLPPLKGYEGVASVFGVMDGVVTKMKHTLHDVQILPDRVMASSTVSYDSIDGSQADVKAFAIMHKGLEEEKAHQYYIYGDFSPAYQALSSIKSKVTADESY